MQRRRLLCTALTASPWLLAGCGFQLRRPLRMPFGSLALTGFGPRSPIAAGLRSGLTEDVALKAVPSEAEVVLQALAERRERSVVASTSSGQVREVQLRLQVIVRADSPTGRALMAPVELRLARDLSFTENAATAKSLEEDALWREMQDDVVAQLLRRLAALSL